MLEFAPEALDEYAQAPTLAAPTARERRKSSIRLAVLVVSRQRAQHGGANRDVSRFTVRKVEQEHQSSFYHDA